ncbi:ribonuclease domain-containing protein [Streptomyces sp. NPDC002055]|uniref:ribonuclease domain-containing protein n=1 Tax=Streptomyces sp. NPDC002055 TaxID=3154534 RepID=UPI0033185BFE
MRIPPRIVRIGALGALASTLFIGGPAVVASASATPGTTATHSVAPAHVASAVSAKELGAQEVGDICYSKLPDEAHTTLKLIDKGGPFPYPKDGTVFSNREGELPDQSGDYYHEYTVETPGSPDRGARRIVTGEAKQEDYYTADHYSSFDKVKFDC